jgi:hypothetical protein
MSAEIRADVGDVAAQRGDGELGCERDAAAGHDDEFRTDFSRRGPAYQLRSGDCIAVVEPGPDRLYVCVAPVVRFVTVPLAAPV